MASYIIPTEEEMTRETELDILLGYELSTADDATPQNKRGDPVLRELADIRLLEEREKCLHFTADGPGRSRKHLLSIIDW
jgi:hypothetical protein